MNYSYNNNQREFLRKNTESQYIQYSLNNSLDHSVLNLTKLTQSNQDDSLLNVKKYQDSYKQKKTTPFILQNIISYEDQINAMKRNMIKNSSCQLSTNQKHRITSSLVDKQLIHIYNNKIVKLIDREIHYNRRSQYQQNTQKNHLESELQLRQKMYDESPIKIGETTDDILGEFEYQQKMILQRSLERSFKAYDQKYGQGRNEYGIFKQNKVKDSLETFVSEQKKSAESSKIAQKIIFERVQVSKRYGSASIKNGFRQQSDPSKFKYGSLRLNQY